MQHPAVTRQEVGIHCGQSITRHTPLSYTHTLRDMGEHARSVWNSKKPLTETSILIVILVIVTVTLYIA